MQLIATATPTQAPLTHLVRRRLTAILSDTPESGQKFQAQLGADEVNVETAQVQHP
jgi:hypothetical protein